MSSKAIRKTRRVAEKVCHEWDIQVSGKRTKCLLVCNAGLTTGASQESLYELCSSNGITPATINLVHGKSYSFVSFPSEEDAATFLDSVHGKVGLKLDEVHSDQPLYLTFVSDLPKNLDENNPWSLDPPKGLLVLPNFVSEDEETTLLSSVEWEQDDKAGQMKNRQVCHFGYDFVYGENSIAEVPNNRPLPESWQEFLKRSIEQGVLPEMPDQCTVNRYEPGHGIPPHIDTHSCCTSHIASLSLGADTVMDFHSSDGGPAIPVLLPRRSLMVMSGEARYKYAHGIASRVSDVIPLSSGGLTLRKRGTRVSLTFRKALRVPCQCDFPLQCDSRQNKQLDVSDKMARELEETHVHTVYQDIAGHFSDTRHTPWPKVVEFLSALPASAVVIDAGCGNGKYLFDNATQFKIGCDRCSGLVDICQSRARQAVVGDCLLLPFRDNCADGVISIAVIHHFSTETRRLRAIQEIVRLLRPGGKALIYAWAKEQSRSESGRSSYLKREQKSKSAFNDKMAKCETDFDLVLPVHENKTDFKHADLLVPWKRKTEEGDKVFHRFYHVYCEGELEAAVDAAIGDLVEVVDTYYDQGNWCVILRKKF